MTTTSHHNTAGRHERTRATKNKNTSTSQRTHTKITPLERLVQHKHSGVTLTTVTTNDNENGSDTDPFRAREKRGSLCGQWPPRRKMEAVRAVLKDRTASKLARTKKKEAKFSTGARPQCSVQWCSRRGHRVGGANLGPPQEVTWYPALCVVSSRCPRFAFLKRFNASTLWRQFKAPERI